MTNREDVKYGGWVVASYKAFSCFDLDDPIFEPYDATVLAGKSAELLSSIRALGSVRRQNFHVYRKLARLREKDAIRVIKELEKIWCDKR